MKVGILEDGLEYKFTIRTKDGALYQVNTQFVACVDDEGRYTGEIGVSPEQTVDILEKFGSISIVRLGLTGDGWKSKKVRVFKLDEIAKVETLHIGSKEVCIQIEPPKKSTLGRLVQRLSNSLG